MRKGDYAAAWQVSDRVLARNAGQRFHHLPRHLQPVWDGRPLEKQRVLVRCYHGLGDSIQFARFLPLLKPQVRELIVWAQPELLDVLNTVPGIDRLLPLHDGSPEVDYDVDVEIMELAYVFRCTLASLPCTVPYLDVGVAAVERKRGINVGLVWRSGDWDERRSLSFSDVRPLLALPHVNVYALQYALLAGEHDARLIVPSQERTVRDTGRMMRSLDLVITVDSMTAHLAGALGVPVWTLLPYAADWRWLEQRSDSPWYPTMRLFRQNERCSWTPVIAEVAATLESYNPFGPGTGR